MVTLERTDSSRSGAAPRRRNRGFRVPTAVWVAASVAVVDYLGAGIPSYWGDEAASVLSASRSLPSLAQELSAVDAVHGLYYMLLHVWIAAFGSGEWATRALSAVAIGALAAGVVVLGRMWFGELTAVVAGLLIAVIPRASSIAIETRGYAITAALAVWIAVWCTRLARSGAPRRRWVVFGVLSGVASWFFLYLILVPLALCLTLAARAPRGARGDRIAAACAAVIGAAPIIALAAAQRHQVSFLAHRGYVSPRGILITPWFSQPPVAAVLWTLIVIGLVSALRRRGTRDGALQAVAWLTVPAVALLAIDALLAPTYNPRYLTVSLGAVALLAAHGITAVFRLASRRERRAANAAAVMMAVGVLAVCAPVFLHQRTPYAKDGGADFRAVAETIAQRADPGDAVLFGDGPRPSRTARLAYRLYPGDFAGLADPQLRTPFDERAALWDDLAPVKDVARTLGAHDVWLVERNGARTAREDLSALRSSGYTLAQDIPLHRSTVYEFTKGIPHHE